MPSQSVSGGIIPTGEITEILIEGDNPGGQINPFGSVTILVDAQVGAPDLGGTITPVGTLTHIDDAGCFPANFICMVEPITEYVDCIGNCEDIPVVTQPTINLSGVIIPVGSLALLANCTPTNVPEVTSQIEGSSYEAFKWFKQAGSFAAQFNSNHIVNSSGFCPSHTIGVFTGHLGDAAPVLPNDYEVFTTVHTHLAAGNGSSPPTGAGVIARVPLTAVFNDISGYYWVWNAQLNKFKLLGFTGGGDLFSSTPFFSVLVDATGYEDQDIELRLRVQGNTITGYVKGPLDSAPVQKAQIVDTTYPTSGRIGIITPWQAGAGAYVKGPFGAVSLTGSGLISDTLVDTDGVFLENHTDVPVKDFTVAWSDPVGFELLTISADAGTIARDIYRERIISGLTPGTTVRVRGTMGLDYGSVGSGVLFGIKIVGGGFQYFGDLLGFSVPFPVDIDITTIVGDSGQIVLRYGAFGDGSLIPAGSEWDNGHYSWVFDVQSLIVLNDCP